VCGWDEGGEERWGRRLCERKSRKRILEQRRGGKRKGDGKKILLNNNGTDASQSRKKKVGANWSKLGKLKTEETKRAAQSEFSIRKKGEQRRDKYR